MGTSIEEAIKDAKIAELLEVVLEIESEVKSIPKKISSELIFLERTRLSRLISGSVTSGTREHRRAG